MKTVVWTDGSCNANGMRGRGGWAALIEQAGTVREISGYADGTTQHRMELTAVCEALEALTGAIEVRTDTPYVEKCFNDNWHERWLRNGAWRGSNGPVKNRDLWERLFGLVWDGRREVTFVRIRGHAGDPNNHRVDRLARAAALSDALPDSFAVVEVVETPAPARRRKPRRASWRELPTAEMAAHLLETPTIGDRVWTDEPRLPRETRTAFIRRVLLGEVEAAEVVETETAEERLTFLNLRAVSRSHLFEAARSLIGNAEPRGPALVVAQAAVEVGVETAIDFALQLRDVHDPLREWVGTSVTSWSPTNERVQGLWTALTGDTISDAPGWAAYKEGTKQRHAFVHRAAAVSEEQAENFITAAEQVVGHIVNVMTEVFPSYAT